MANFSEFQGARQGAPRRGLAVTVSTRGELLLSSDAMEALGSPRLVRLSSDPVEGKVAVVPVRRAGRGACPVKANKAAGHVRAKRFCDSLGLDLSVTRRFPVTVENGRAVFDYRSGPSVVVAGNGAAKKGAVA